MSERSSGLFFNKKPSPEIERKIWPPPPKLRSASSMASLNTPNGDSTLVHNKLSQSSFYLNQNISNEAEAIKKRKKWYKMFLPPSSKDSKMRREKVIEELPEIKEPKDKKRWYKIKKKEKQKKVAVACES